MVRVVFEEDLRLLEQVCRETWLPLYRSVYLRVQNREEAEDITQETYARYLAHTGFREIEDPLAYLKAVALNLFRDRWRQKRRRGEDLDFDALQLAAEGDMPDGVHQEMLVRQALDKLAPEQRRVIELRILEGRSVAEAARAMGRRPGAVRVLQYRALKKLAAILDEEEERHA